MAVTKIGPMDNPRLTTSNGMKLLETGNLDGATTMFQRALTMNDRFIPATLGLAKAKEVQGDMDNAQEWAYKALANALSEDDEILARTTLMEIQLTFRRGEWLPRVDPHRNR